MISSPLGKRGRRVLGKDRRAIRRMLIQTDQMQQVNYGYIVGNQKEESFKGHKIGTLRKMMMK